MFGHLQEASIESAVVATQQTNFFVISSAFISIAARKKSAPGIAMRCSDSETGRKITRAPTRTIFLFSIAAYKREKEEEETLGILDLPVLNSPRAVRGMASDRRSYRNSRESRLPGCGSPGTVRD